MTGHCEQHETVLAKVDLTARLDERLKAIERLFWPMITGTIAAFATTVINAVLIFKGK